MSRDLAWGRYFNYPHRMKHIHWRNEPLPITKGSTLPYGMGRSYGDSCLNGNNTLLDTRLLKRFISFDKASGIICCEAGVTLEEIIRFALPKGWFLPVTPGTKFVTLGGAIANDVHGKNHHINGSFGCHVKEFKLTRSNNQQLYCSPTENEALFSATIGGLGLTGLITEVTLQLMPVDNALLCIEEIQYDNFEAFLALNEASKDWEYTVAWVDSLASGTNLGRGIFIRARHAPAQIQNMSTRLNGQRKKLSVPFSFPNISLNKLSIGLFNQVYWRKNLKRKKRYIGDYDAFFYPLDAIHHWNRIYGNRGFLQYQFVVPFESEHATREILSAISKSQGGSFLTVLKVFGDISSPGLLSFPCPGITFALDFPNRGQTTLNLLESFDRLVLKFGGKVYPAKDARMSGNAFKAFYPNYGEFKHFIDPAFSSSFWRRVMESKS